MNKHNNGILVIAGHYCVTDDYSELSNLAETEVNSLKLGIKQYHRCLQQGNHVKLVIWVNDIGLGALERQQFQQSYQLPFNYAELLQNAEISLSNIVIRFESKARNRASKIVRQLKRDNPALIKESLSDNSELIRCIDSDFCNGVQKTKTVFTISDINGLPLVIKEGGAAKCCAILAVFFTELVASFQPNKIFGVFNFVYKERIKLGLFVAQTLLDFDTPTSCLFCNETQTIKEGIDYAEI